MTLIKTPLFVVLVFSMASLGWADEDFSAPLTLRIPKSTLGYQADPAHEKGESAVYQTDGKLYPEGANTTKLSALPGGAEPMMTFKKLIAAFSTQDPNNVRTLYEARGAAALTKLLSDPQIKARWMSETGRMSAGNLVAVIQVDPGTYYFLIKYLGRVDLPTTAVASWRLDLAGYSLHQYFYPGDYRHCGRRELGSNASRQFCNPLHFHPDHVLRHSCPSIFDRRNRLAWNGVHVADTGRRIFADPSRFAAHGLSLLDFALFCGSPLTDVVLCRPDNGRSRLADIRLRERQSDRGKDGPGKPLSGTVPCQHAHPGAERKFCHPHCSQWSVVGRLLAVLADDSPGARFTGDVASRASFQITNVPSGCYMRSAPLHGRFSPAR